MDIYKETNNTDNSEEIIEYIDEPDEIEILDYIDIESFDMDTIPANISISTMSLTCYLGTLFKMDNIYNYMILDLSNVVDIKSSKGRRYIKGYTPKSKKSNFFNQTTIMMKVEDNKYINIKLFKNGSIQMTGCRDLIHANIAISKLIYKLKERLMITLDNSDNSDNSNNFKEIIFVDNPENISVSKFKIDLINSNFGISYNINREQLYNILTQEGVFCRLSSIHACVNIKFKSIEPVTNTETLVSIFVFQTGNIIITGAKKAKQVKDAYNYIVRFLNKNKMNIMKKDINSILSNVEINNILTN